jgi:hypothetical protein
MLVKNKDFIDVILKDSKVFKEKSDDNIDIY